MKVGFTGTQSGMTEDQAIAFTSLLKDLNAKELHHGDCIGADAQANKIALALGVETIIHPPTDSRRRAFCLGAKEVKPPLPFLKRNHKIVDDCYSLIATPVGYEEVLRSDTWATIRYGRSLSKPVIIIHPDGDIQRL